MKDSDNIDYTHYETRIAERIENPIVLLIRLREIIQPLGFVDKNEMKNLICKYIDECHVNNFSFHFDGNH